MKKVKSICLVLVLCGLLCACSTLFSAVPGDTSKAQIALGDSKKFSKEEIQSAMDFVLSEFKKNYKNCTLARLWYDEEQSDRETDYYLQEDELIFNMTGKHIEPKEEHMITIQSAFFTGSQPRDDGFGENETHDDWHFVLVRENVNSDWMLMTYGNC